MIRYRLKCSKAHEFEAWFASSDAYDSQAKRRLLACPRCGSKQVEKAMMAPRVAKSASKRARSARPEATAEAAKPEAVVEAAPTTKPDTQRVAAHSELVAAMRRLRAEVEAKSEYVGRRFPEEARKIQNEEVPARGIHGEATAEEAKALSEEGIEFFPLPLLPEDHN
jgi:hypothetical protein